MCFIVDYQSFKTLNARREKTSDDKLKILRYNSQTFIYKSNI